MTKSITRIAATSIATLGALNGALPAQAEVQPSQSVENVCFEDQKPSSDCVKAIGKLLLSKGYIDELPENQRQTYLNVVGEEPDGVIGEKFIGHILAGDGLDPELPEGVFVSKADQVGSVRKGPKRHIFAVTTGSDKARTIKTNSGTKEVRAHTPVGKYKVARFYKQKRISSETPGSLNQDPEYIDKNWNMRDIAYSNAVDENGNDRGIAIHGSPHIKELGNRQIIINKETGEKKSGSNACIRTSPEVAALNLKLLKAGDPFVIVEDHDYMLNSRVKPNGLAKTENQKTIKNTPPALKPEVTPDTTDPPNTIPPSQIVTPVVTVNMNSAASTDQKGAVSINRTVTEVAP